MDAPGLKTFLAAHADAERLENGKVRCTLTGHEVPPRLDALEAYWGGKSYRKRAERAAYDFSKHEPWLVAHTKSEHLLWCTLTGRPVSRTPKAVEGHVRGRRFLRLRKEARAKEKAAAAAGEEGGGEAAGGGGDDEFDPDDWSFAREAEEADGEVAAESDAEPAGEDDADEAAVDAAGDDFWVRGKSAASNDARSGTVRSGAGKRGRVDGGGKRERAAGAPARKQRRAGAGSEASGGAKGKAAKPNGAAKGAHRPAAAAAARAVKAGKSSKAGRCK